MLLEFSMVDCLPATTPLPTGTNLSTDSSYPPVDPGLYCRMVGKLIYLTNTLPNLSFAIGLVSRFMQDPREDHLQATKHIFWYIKGTLHFGIFYPRHAPLELTAFTDADWASCATTRRSVGAYLILLGGSPISWNSKRQVTTSKSSTESEYLALSMDPRSSLPETPFD